MFGFSLLRLCWEGQKHGGLTATIARTFFPRSFVLGRLPAKDVTTFTAERLARKSSIAHFTPHEIISTLLRSVILMDENSRIVGTAKDNKSDISEKKDDSANVTSSARTNSTTTPPLLEELTLLSTVALEVVGSTDDAALDAELWGCTIGAAAACAARQLLVDTALSLKAAQPTAEFIETVMLTAIDCLQSRDWRLSKLVVAELARALSSEKSSSSSSSSSPSLLNQVSDKVISRILTRQQDQQRSKKQQQQQQSNDEEEQQNAVRKEDDIAAIAQEFFGV